MSHPFVKSILIGSINDAELEPTAIVNSRVPWKVKVTLNGPAPQGGVKVTLVSSNPKVVPVLRPGSSVPGSTSQFTIPPGSKSTTIVKMPAVNFAAPSGSILPVVITAQPASDPTQFVPGKPQVVASATLIASSPF